jgi:ACS family glucarate transporter-like MFS transporter
MPRAGSDRPAHHTHVRWQLVFLLFLLSAVTYLDRVNLSIAGPALMRDYHLSELQLGWMFSAFLAGYGLMQAPAGRIADRVGPRLALTAGTIWWGLFTALVTVIPGRLGVSLIALIAVRFLLGSGEAILYPASTLLIGRWIPDEEKGKANGLIFAGVGVGAGITPPIIAFTMLHFGWRVSFWLCSVVGLVVGAIWYAMARDNPADHPRVSRAEYARIAVSEPVAFCLHEGSRRTFAPWRLIVSNRHILAITASYFSFGYVAWLFFSWFYIYLAQERHLNLKSSALYGMLPFIAMAIGSALGGVLSDRMTLHFGKRIGRCALASIALVLAAIFLVIGIKTQGAPLAAIILSGGAGTLYLAQSSFWSVSTDIAREHSGTVSGCMNMGAQAGGAVTASVTPWIALHFGWSASFFTAAVLALVGSALWLTVDPQSSLGKSDMSSL